HSSCCTCNCHEDTSTIIFTPTRWFPRIKRRSSSSSTCTTVSYESRVSSEYSLDAEEKQILEFEQLYSLAVDEMAYAIESQGSIYYSGDLITATEAVDACLDRFRHLMQTLHPDRSHRFQEEWTDALFELRSRLDALPYHKDADV
ncbi:hypothetical protein INT47_011943, partial [Mucor saturninus]